MSQLGVSMCYDSDTLSIIPQKKKPVNLIFHVLSHECDTKMNSRRKIPCVNHSQLGSHLCVDCLMSDKLPQL